MRYEIASLYFTEILLLNSVIWRQETSVLRFRQNWIHALTETGIVLAFVVL